MVPRWVSVTETAAPATAAPVESVTLPRICPVVVCAVSGRQSANVNETTPRTRMRFDVERMTTSKLPHPLVLTTSVSNHPKRPDHPSPATSAIKIRKDRRVEGIALTRPTRQVVFWSDRKTGIGRGSSPAVRLLSEAAELPRHRGSQKHGHRHYESSHW